MIFFFNIIPGCAVKSFTGGINKSNRFTESYRTKIRNKKRRNRANKKASLRRKKSSSGSGGGSGAGGNGGDDPNYAKNKYFYVKILLIEILLNLLEELVRVALVLGDIRINNRGNSSFDVDFSGISFDINSYITNLQEFIPYINESHPHYNDELNFIWTTMNLIRDSHININNPVNMVTLEREQLDGVISNLNALIVVIEVILDYLYPDHDAV